MPDQAWILAILFCSVICKGQRSFLEALNDGDLNTLLVESPWPIRFKSRPRVIRNGKHKDQTARLPTKPTDDHPKRQERNGKHKDQTARLPTKPTYDHPKRQEKYKRILYDEQSDINGRLGDKIYLLSSFDLRTRFKSRRKYKNNNVSHKNQTFKMNNLNKRQLDKFQTENSKLTRVPNRKNIDRNFTRQFIPEMLFRTPNWRRRWLKRYRQPFSSYRKTGKIPVDTYLQHANHSLDRPARYYKY